MLEKGWGVSYEGDKEILYERIELVRPENHDQMLEDLRRRTGLAVKRFEVGDIDFLRDTARVTIYFDIDRDVEQ